MKSSLDVQEAKQVKIELPKILVTLGLTGGAREPLGAGAAS